MVSIEPIMLALSPVNSPIIMRSSARGLIRMTTRATS
jgi:hypothetical protein